MNFYLILGLIVIILAVFSLNYFIYYSTLHLNSITDTAIKKTIGVILLFLSLSFIFASVLAHFYSNPCIRYYYLLSSVWHGVLLYLLLSLAAAWLVIWLGSIMNYNPPKQILFFLSIIFSIGISLYGIVSARNIEIKTITVGISNLPASWENKKIIQIADLHLGIVNGRNFIENIVKQINRLHPEAVFIPGDYFDGTTKNYQELAEPLIKLAAPKGIYFVSGNHETYIDTEASLSALAGNGVRILDDAVINLEGLAIAGASYPKRGQPKDIANLLRSVYPEIPSIFLYHEPKFVNQAAAAGIDLQLSGHAHHGQLYPLNLITRLIYSKFHYGLHRINGYSIYTTSGVGAWGPPMRIGANPEIVEIILEKK